MPSNLFDLTGRVALVSGAAQGMGRAMATALAEAGADLMLVDINTAGVEQTAQRLAAVGRRAVPVTCRGARLPLGGRCATMLVTGPRDPWLASGAAGSAFRRRFEFS